MRKESPFSRTVILRIVFYEIRKTGNGPYSFNVFCNLSSSVISISYSRCSAGTAVNANVLVTNCPEDPVKNEIQSLIFFLQLLRESEANSMRLSEQAKVLKEEIRRYFNKPLESECLS